LMKEVRLLREERNKSAKPEPKVNEATKG